MLSGSLAIHSRSCLIMRLRSYKKPTSEVAEFPCRTLYQKWLLDREEQLLDNRHIRLLGRENYPEAEEERSEAKRQRIEASVDPSSGKSELVQDKFSDSSDSEAKVEKLVGEI